jgi:Mg/Co/Ni transporter MgtE
LIYIVSDDEERILRGMISLRNLFASADEQQLEEIMDPYIATLSSIEPAIEAAYRVVGSQLAALPVIELNKKLIGAVTIDAAITKITPSDNSETLRIFS